MFNLLQITLTINCGFKLKWSDESAVTFDGTPEVEVFLVWPIFRNKALGSSRTGIPVEKNIIPSVGVGYKRYIFR